MKYNALFEAGRVLSFTAISTIDELFFLLVSLKRIQATFLSSLPNCFK